MVLPALRTLDQGAERLEQLPVGRLVLTDAGQELDLDALEDVRDELCGELRLHRQRPGERRRPLLEHRREQLPPTLRCLAPALRQRLVGEAGSPELPEDADIARAD